MSSFLRYYSGPPLVLGSDYDTFKVAVRRSAITVSFSINPRRRSWVAWDTKATTSGPTSVTPIGRPKRGHKRSPFTHKNTYLLQRELSWSLEEKSAVDKEIKTTINENLKQRARTESCSSILLTGVVHSPILRDWSCNNASSVSGSDVSRKKASVPTFQEDSAEHLLRRQEGLVLTWLHHGADRGGEDEGVLLSEVHSSHGGYVVNIIVFPATHLGRQQCTSISFYLHVAYKPEIKTSLLIRSWSLFEAWILGLYGEGKKSI